MGAQEAGSTPRLQWGPLPIGQSGILCDGLGTRSVLRGRKRPLLAESVSAETLSTFGRANIQFCCLGVVSSSAHQMFAEFKPSYPLRQLDARVGFIGASITLPLLADWDFWVAYSLHGCDGRSTRKEQSARRKQRMFRNGEKLLIGSISITIDLETQRGTQCCELTCSHRQLEKSRLPERSMSVAVEGIVSSNTCSWVRSPDWKRVCGVSNGSINSRQCAANGNWTSLSSRRWASGSHNL